MVLGVAWTTIWSSGSGIFKEVNLYGFPHILCGILLHIRKTSPSNFSKERSGSSFWFTTIWHSGLGTLKYPPYKPDLKTFKIPRNSCFVQGYIQNDMIWILFFFLILRIFWTVFNLLGGCKTVCGSELYAGLNYLQDYNPIILKISAR